MNKKREIKKKSTPNFSHYRSSGTRPFKKNEINFNTHHFEFLFLNLLTVAFLFKIGFINGKEFEL